MSGALQLLLTLTGVTFLFGCAQANGTMEGAARQALRLCGGRAIMLPLAFFLLAAVMAMIGPGAILSTALVIPFAMSVGPKAGMTPFLVALMVGNGANAGNLSPFSTVGAIVSGLMTRAGLGGHEFRVWAYHAGAHVIVATAAFLLFGGLRFRSQSGQLNVPAPPAMDSRHLITLGITGAWIAGVLVFKWPLGVSALVAGLFVVALRAAGLQAAIRHIPWKVILMVVGISTAVGLLERAGGLAWFQNLLVRVSTPQSVHAVIGLLTGAISAYSSTSSVVLPAFLPMVPGLAARLPGVDPLQLAISVNVGSALVDVSPLSTIGALAIAAAPEDCDKARLFRQLLAWGLSMSVVGAAFCYFAAL